LAYYATTSIALLIGILLYNNIIINYLYLIDDIGNIIISIIMIIISYHGLYELSERYKNKSYFDVIFKILPDISHVDNNSHVDNSHNIEYVDSSHNDDDNGNNNTHNVLLFKV
jgi:hypothetical protein